ncbi:MAG: ABC transporter permease [Pseudomonadota bacterium]
MGGAILGLAWRSLVNRKGSALLTILAVALSVALFLGVEKARSGAKAGFSSTISGTDLIVGARSGQINLLLYSVFRMGDATAEVSWPTYQWLDGREDVAWTVPLSLGDSHRGFRVLGTTTAYFERYQYAGGQTLTLAQGKRFEDLFDAVLGADVARALGYEIDTPLVLSHGLGRAGLQQHDDRPFRVSGILAPTGTPVDRTIHVSLEAITAIHVGWETGTRNPLTDTITEDMIRSFDLTPRTITAVLVGLESRPSILRTKRSIDTYRGEALMAILPGVALTQLWSVTSIAERALLAVSLFVVAVGLVSILVSILTSLNARRREMSILRAIGARPGHIFTLLVAEAALLGFIGAVIGMVLVNGTLAAAGPFLASRYGVNMVGTGPGVLDLSTVGAVTFAALVVGTVPAWLAFRRSLSDGLSVKL